MGGIPDIVFLIMGIIGILLLISINIRLAKKHNAKKRPRGMSFKELTYHRSRYLYHARNYREGS